MKKNRIIASRQQDVPISPREPPSWDVVTPTAPCMQPQHVRSPSPRVLDWITSFAKDNVANCSFFLGHHNEASRWDNCGDFWKLKLLSQQNALRKFSHSRAMVCPSKAHIRTRVCVRVLLDYSMRIDPSRETSMSVSLWGSELRHYSFMWPCLIVSQHFFFLPFITPLDKRTRTREEVDSALYLRSGSQGGSGEGEQKPPQKAEVWGNLKGGREGDCKLDI